MPVNVNGFSCELAGGVRETTQTTGTGTYSLDGFAIVDGITYRTFVAGVGSGTTTVYTVRLGAQFETGIGTVTSGAPATITRDSILESSNSDNAVNWGSGAKDIILDAPAAVFHSLQTDVSSRALKTTVFGSVKVTTFTSNGTFTTDAKCLFARVRMVGGGGAGGGALVTGVGQNSSGSGGGAGEYAEGMFTAAQLGASKAVTIGAGGSGGTGSPANSGGTTSLGTLMTAVGGGGGEPGPATAGNTTVNGGAGGSGGTGGNFRAAGGDGSNGTVRAGIQGVDGDGGASLLSGARRGLVSTSGRDGRAYGGGGTGANNTASTGSTAGGSGAPGIVIVEEFLSV